jgi:hypothetical protein
MPNDYRNHTIMVEESRVDHKRLVVEKQSILPGKAGDDDIVYPIQRCIAARNGAG